MGVTGLLRLLQPYSEPRVVSHFQGKTLGVDGYAWLHRAAASCAEDLLRGIPSPRLVQSIDNRVRVYERNGVDLYFVFDGSSLAMKQRVEAQRRRIREAARAQSSSSGSFSSGNSALRGVDITASHAAMVIAYLKARGIRYVVAPYEADAQLVWLESNGFIDGIISEDSDMLVFGAKSLLTKCDARTGDCIEVSCERMPYPLADAPSLRALAIISGCDYSPGVNGLGPVKTKALVTKFGGDLNAMVDSLVAAQRVDADFAQIARQADLAFQYQRVWNPAKCCLTYLNEPEPHLLEHLTDTVVGAELARAVAHRMAVGTLDPSDYSRVLVVDPVISAFVNRMGPVASRKSASTTTSSSSFLTSSRSVNRRLQIPVPAATPFRSAPQLRSPPLPSPNTPTISRFFKRTSKPDKENIEISELATPRSNELGESPGMKRGRSAHSDDEHSGMQSPFENVSKIVRTDTIVDTIPAVPRLPSLQQSTLLDDTTPTKPLRQVVDPAPDKLASIRKFAYRPQP